MNAPSQNDRLLELIDKLQNQGNLDKTDAAELETILADDEDAREVYVLSQEIHTMLEVEKSVRLQLALDQLPGNVVRMPGTEPVEVPWAVREQSRLASPQADQSASPKFRMRLATSFAAMLAALIGIVWIYVKISPSSQPIADEKNKAGKNSNLVAANRDNSEPISFHRDIEPILADNCFSCHGADEENREADLRLDLPEKDATRDESIIVKGDPGKSELIARISSTDPEYFMPPPDSEKRLSKVQIELLEKWIGLGASYEDTVSTEGKSLILKLSDD